jgi:methionyl-tRNA formyltransferase
MKINKIIFMGTPQFAVPALQLLSDNGYKPVLCVTQPDKVRGRKQRLTAPVLKQKAQELGIAVMQPENINSKESIEQIRCIAPDLIVTAAYGGYIGRELRKIARAGAINIHPSLLPAWRGATPVNASLWAGDQITGVTIFRLVAKMDAGSVLSQSSYTILEDDNYSILLAKLAEQGASDLLKLLKQLDNDIVVEKAQAEEMVSTCHKLIKEDLQINWADKAEHIYNQVRALAEKPGASTKFRHKPIKIISVKLTGQKTEAVAGSVIEVLKNQGIVVAAGDEQILITRLQPAGKRLMTGFDFNLGARIESGEKFGEADGSE